MQNLIINTHTDRSMRANRAVGAMFFSVFGCAWIAFWSVQTFPGNWALTAAILLTGLTVLAQSIRVFKENKPAIPDESEQRKKMDRYFHLINSGQWVVIFICATVLNNLGKSDWVLMSIIFIVGLHFIPMARLFRYAPHYLMGLAIMIWAAAYAYLFGPANTIGCLGIGLILWSGAIYALMPKAAAKKAVQSI